MRKMTAEGKENDEGSSDSNTMLIVEVEMATAVRVELSRPVSLMISHKSKDKPPVSSLRRKLRSKANECFRPETVGRAIVSFFPILSWFPEYSWRDDLLADVLAGLTVGIMSIPQGMAYARLAGMPPVYGLYTNIIPTFVYFLLGTTKHAAIGPATVLSLIMSSIRYKHIPCQDCWMYSSGNVSNQSAIFGARVIPMLTPIDVGSAAAFLAGVFLILMGLFRLSFISDYLPDQLVGGFTVAAAVQVFAGQLPSIFGVNMPNRNGIGKVILNFFDLFSMISHINLVTLLIFMVCLVFLVCSKHFVNPFFQRRLRIPFPGEFIVMIASTMVSHFTQVHDKYDVSVVQHIAAGLPTPVVPKMSLMNSLMTDSFVLAVITYTYSISLAKLYAKRNGYKIQTTQEFYAYGFMNLIGSFFQCFNSGQSVARSLVYEMAGARSQLCGMIGTLVVIVTVLFIAPFLESLPNAALASIIVTAVLEMLRNLRELGPLFRKSRYDFSIYLVTLISVIVLDVTFGLVVSVLFALATVLAQVQRSHVEIASDQARILYSSDDLCDVKADQDTFDDHRFWKRLIVLRPTAPIFYVNAEKFKNRLLEATFEHNSSDGVEQSGEDTARDPMLTEKLPLTIASDPPKSMSPAVLILDMSAVAFMDLMGINALDDVRRRLVEKETELFLCGCTKSVMGLMRRTGFLDNSNVFVFPTVLDAISFARFRLNDDRSMIDENQSDQAMS